MLPPMSYKVTFYHNVLAYGVNSASMDGAKKITPFANPRPLLRTWILAGDRVVPCQPYGRTLQILRAAAGVLGLAVSAK